MRILTSVLVLAATPALAAEGKPFFSLANTDFIVTISFLGFVGILIYFGVPKIVGDMLDSIRLPGSMALASSPTTP